MRKRIEGTGGLLINGFFDTVFLLLDGHDANRFTD